VSDAINRLLLAALQRAGAPLASDDLLDRACGLALDEQWPTAAVAKLSRKSVASRLKGMVTAGQVRLAGQARDNAARRDTPLYEPSAGWNAQAPVPAPESQSARAGATKGAYDEMTPRQRLAIFESHDMILESLSRLLAHLQVGLADMAQTREKARQRLLAEGLEPR